MSSIVNCVFEVKSLEHVFNKVLDIGFRISKEPNGHLRCELSDPSVEKITAFFCLVNDNLESDEYDGCHTLSSEENTSGEYNIVRNDLSVLPSKLEQHVVGEKKKKKGGDEGALEDKHKKKDIEPYNYLLQEEGSKRYSDTKRDMRSNVLEEGKSKEILDTVVDCDPVRKKSDNASKMESRDVVNNDEQEYNASCTVSSNSKGTNEQDNRISKTRCVSNENLRQPVEYWNEPEPESKKQYYCRDKSSSKLEMSHVPRGIHDETGSSGRDDCYETVRNAHDVDTTEWKEKTEIPESQYLNTTKHADEERMNTATDFREVGTRRRDQGVSYATMTNAYDYGTTKGKEKTEISERNRRDKSQYWNATKDTSTATDFREAGTRRRDQGVSYATMTSAYDYEYDVGTTKGKEKTEISERNSRDKSQYLNATKDTYVERMITAPDFSKRATLRDEDGEGVPESTVFVFSKPDFLRAKELAIARLDKSVLECFDNYKESFGDYIIKIYDKKTIGKVRAIHKEVMNRKSTQAAGAENTQATCGGQRFTGRKSNLTVELLRTDITKMKVDVIVNAANNRLNHKSGVARAIADAAGEILKANCTEHISQRGELLVTELYASRVGNLDVKKVYHAVGPKWNKYGENEANRCKKDLRQTVLRCLLQAEQDSYSSIAFPSISAAIYKVPKEICVESYMKAVLHFDELRTTSRTTLCHVYFVNTDDIMLEAIKDHFSSCWHRQLDSEELKIDRTFMHRFRNKVPRPNHW